ncbi:hypothetical protein H4219_003855 [Mycoemilia scoparia]|uniref:HMG box domain-containing protein n=1 Tax=Mycoemilia scoparia TaxID=417184 RepID=A0A9W8DS30_9FUNG|nr:hypothetical protein H4219_003855 [Mycoemilia scoparia]
MNINPGLGSPKVAVPRLVSAKTHQKAKEIAAAHPHLNQSEISRMVASSWKKEPQCVIDKYRRLHYEKKDIINAIVKERGKGADFSDLHYQKGKKKRSRDRATTSSDEDSSVSDFGSGMSLESPPISYLPPQDRSGSPSSSSTTSANCRSGVKKRRVTKPTNTFIEYRKYIMARLDDANLDYNQVELSRITSTLWKSEPPEIKNRFKDNYQKTKLEYAAKSSQKKRRGQRTTALLTPLTSTENKSFPFDFKSPPDNLTNAASRKYDGVNSNKCSRLPPICNPQSNISANTTHHSSPVSTSSSSYSMYGGSVANTTFSPFTQHQNKAISTQGLLDIGRRLSVPTMPATHMGLTVPQYQSTSPHSNAYKDRRSSSSSSILELPKIQISNHHSNQNITPMTKLTLSGDKISPQIHNQGINVSGYYEIGITTNGSNAGPRLPSISSLVSTRATINNTRLSIEETKQPLLVCNEYSRPSHAETNCCKRTTKNIKMGSIDFLLCFPTFHKTSNNINTRESSSPQHMQLSEQVNRQQDKMPKFLSSPPMDIESPSMLSTPTFRTPDTLSISNSRANSIQL